MNKTRSANIEELSCALTYVELALTGTVMIAVCAVTFFGNALVMASFILDKKLRTLNNYFIMSLAVSDLMIAAFSMPLFITYLMIGEWTLGPALCNMWLAQDYTCSNASCLNLLMIALDRYFSVTDPLGYRVKRTPKRVGLMIACVWIIAFLLWPPWIYSWPYIEGKRTVPDDDCYVQFLETNTTATIISTILDYYLPVSILLILYYKIWKETRRRSRYLADMETGYQTASTFLQPLNSEKIKTELSLKLIHASYPTDQDNPKSDSEAERDIETSLLADTTANVLETANGAKHDDKSEDQMPEQIPDKVSIHSSQPSQYKTSVKPKGGFKHDKAARVLTVILLAYIVTTLPYNIIVIIMNLDTTHKMVPYAVWSFFYYFFYINSTLNPFCYALANKNFRRTYWRILSCSWSKNHGTMYSDGSYSNKSSESKLSQNTRHVISVK